MAQRISFEERVLIDEMRAAGAAWRRQRTKGAESGRLPALSMAVSERLGMGWSFHAAADLAEASQRRRPVDPAGADCYGVVNVWEFRLPPWS